MRIVLDARSITSTSGGYLRGLVRGLASQPSQDEIIVLLPPGGSDLVPRVSHLSPLTVSFNNFSWGEQFGLLRLLRRLSPDLVHFAFPQHPYFYKGKYVVTIHDTIMLDWPGRLIKKMTFKPIFRHALKANHIIVPTKHVQQHLITSWGVNPNKTTQIYEAGELFVAPGKLPDLLIGKKYLLTVNNGLPHKNNQYLIAAHQKLITEFPDIFLVLAGKNDWKSLKNQAGLKNVIFISQLSQAQLAATYKQAFAFVTASLAEGFGLPGLEAMHFGIPVISSQASCLPEVYGPAAVYFDPTKPDQAVSAMRRVIKDPKKRQKLVEAGRRRCQKFSWQQTARLTLKVYERSFR